MLASFLLGIPSRMLLPRMLPEWQTRDCRCLQSYTLISVTSSLEKSIDNVINLPADSKHLHRLQDSVQFQVHIPCMLVSMFPTKKLGRSYGTNLQIWLEMKAAYKIESPILVWDEPSEQFLHRLGLQRRRAPVPHDACVTSHSHSSPQSHPKAQTTDENKLL